jgi:hypothetical protein
MKSIQTDLKLIDRDWIESKMPVFQSWLNEWGTAFTSDDLHTVLGDPPHPNWLGVLLAKAKNLDLIEKIGWRESERKAANGRVVRLWQKKVNQ